MRPTSTKTPSVTPTATPKVYTNPAGVRVLHMPFSLSASMLRYPALVAAQVEHGGIPLTGPHGSVGVEHLMDLLALYRDIIPLPPHGPGFVYRPQREEDAMKEVLAAAWETTCHEEKDGDEEDGEMVASVGPKT